MSCEANAIKKFIASGEASPDGESRVTLQAFAAKRSAQAAPNGDFEAAWADTQILAALMQEQHLQLLREKHLPRGKPTAAMAAGYAAVLSTLQSSGLVRPDQLRRVAGDRSQPAEVRIRAKAMILEGAASAAQTADAAVTRFKSAPHGDTVVRMVQDGQQIRPSQWIKMIDEPPEGLSADDIRFLRYSYNALSQGREVASREDWQAMLGLVRQNNQRGRSTEDETLNQLGIENNNYNTSGGAKRKVVLFASPNMQYSDGSPIVTRPDGISPSHWVDVKSIESKTPIYHNTQQLRAQREGARLEGRRSAVIFTSQGVIPKPSTSLADQSVGADVIYWRKSTRLPDGQEQVQWAQWQQEAVSGQWQPVSFDAVKKSIAVTSPMPDAS